MNERPLSHEEARDLLGPYVIGGLEPGEEWGMDRHLAGCPECRSEERELRRVHEQLYDLSVATVEPPPELKERVMGLLPRKRRRRLAPLIAAAAALCVLAALTFIPGLSNGDEVAAAALNPTDFAPEAGGEVRLYDEGSNVRVSVEVWGMPEPKPGEYYELWFVEDGERMSGGTFSVQPDGRIEAEMNAPAAAGEYPQVGVTMERDDGDPLPSDRKILGGELQRS
jgi:hypothetical protein